MPEAAIERHKTALHRTDLSKPVRLALQDEIINENCRVFDYGCGRGEDVRRLRRQGVHCSGWDPVFSPHTTKTKANIVNLGYVINVIEDETERHDALRYAWNLAEKVLVVAARLVDESRYVSHASFRDGVVTRRGTFQKFFDQQELRNWVNQTLGVHSVPAAPGIFYVFRENEDRERFVASRFRRRVALPRLKRSEVLYEEHKHLLEPLMEFFARRGRLPEPNELDIAAGLTETFGTIKRAFLIIRRVTGDEEWEKILEERALDLLVYLALSRFDGRPQFSKLPKEIQLDVKAFFGTYTKACEAADELLFVVGDMENVNAACEASTIGKLTPAALYVHESALSPLSSLLRIYEGCARGYIGVVEGANIIKFSRAKPKVSYLSYPDFERDPHPALHSATSVNLQTFRLKNRRYWPSPNPPVLHRKEAFVLDVHPLRAKFERLTKQEERWGLFEDPSRMGTKLSWESLLSAKALALRGHRIVIQR